MIRLDCSDSSYSNPLLLESAHVFHQAEQYNMPLATSFNCKTSRIELHKTIIMLNSINKIVEVVNLLVYLYVND